MRSRWRITAALVAGLSTLALSAPAFAEDPQRPEIQYALDAVPGGVVVDSSHVVWPDLGMELTVASPTARAVGGCATGYHCAFSGTAMTGSKLSWSTCGVHTTSALPAVRSIANARSSGSTQARTSSGSVLATATAGFWVNVSGSAQNVRCSP